MRKIIFFDTETTGLPKYYNAPITQENNWPRLVQLAFLEYFEDGSLSAKHNYIIKPEGFSIPRDATLIHRISNQQAQTEGHDLTKVLDLFADAINESVILIAHNFDFDKNIVGAEFVRKNFDTKPLLTKRSFCTMKNKNVVNFCEIQGKNGYKWPKLEDLYFKLFKEKISNAHDASVDIQATAKCFWQLLKLGVVR
ncbi:3'-5' exonuclease [Emticicia sp. SJ17W-69]|uniref:3'-5' exonuclease n=1 Tax=Emticicia sp. SJ17W-69 TaxID=3421657 RepID=UPI003EBDCBFC